MIELQSQPHDATVVPPDKRADLIPSHVTLRRELNQLEQDNILNASLWALERSHDPVREEFARKLHKRMFRKVWRWAGGYRAANTNLGVDKTLIQQSLYQVFDNTRYWIDKKTFEPDEIAARFHHGLVAVHPFVDGNGRWSRLVADVLIKRLGGARFTWGGGDLGDTSEMRKTYIDALKAADAHDFTLLLKFARS